ncbi:MAG: ArsA family ATPase [Litorilinea sp.]
MRIILYLGKGGVGKTTIAAASAVRSAALGHRTLVVSTDIAHSLGDSLDVSLESQPKQIAPNLDAQEINVLDEIRRHWGDMQGYVGNLLRRQGISKVVAEEMAVIPGMEEVVSLLHIHRQALEGHYDRVIVDAAPTGETMRLLTIPETFQWYVGRVSGWGDMTMRMASGLMRRVMPEKDILTGLNSLVAGVKELQKVLIDPDVTSYRVVVNPEKMVLKEGARALTYLALYGYPVDAVMINRILPGIASDGQGAATVVAPSADPYLHGLQKIQAQYLGEIERQFYPLPLFRAPWYETEMVGLAHLDNLAAQLFGSHDPGAIFHRGATHTIEEAGDDYLLKLPLPNVELDKVRLTKRGDELFVSIGNFKRELLLPATLARREAAGATFADGVLQIRFVEADTVAENL